MTHKLTIETKMKVDNIIENNVLNVSVLDSKVKLYKAFVLEYVIGKIKDKLIVKVKYLIVFRSLAIFKHIR